MLRTEQATAEVGRLRGCASPRPGEKLGRLYRLVENDDDEPNNLSTEQFSTLRSQRDPAKAALGQVRMVSLKPTDVDPELIERFGRLLRENVTSGEIPFRKTWLQAIVDRVEVGADVIRIVGDKESWRMP